MPVPSFESHPISYDFFLIISRLFPFPRYHEVPLIDEKTRCYQFEKYTVSEFITRNSSLHRLIPYTDWPVSVA